MPLFRHAIRSQEVLIHCYIGNGQDPMYYDIIMCLKDVDFTPGIGGSFFNHPYEQH